MLDYAGGTVVHINAGVAGLMCALVLGKRKGLGNESMAPHNLVLTMIGASLLWVGWFGFNAGSAVTAGGNAGMAMAVTQIATAAAALTWMFAEWFGHGKPSALGLASGAVAGLVAITPASGFVGAILTGVFIDSGFGGSGLPEGVSLGGQVVKQVIGAGTTIVYTAVVSLVILKVLDMVIGLRVTDEQEQEGLDLVLHDEQGYNLT